MAIYHVERTDQNHYDEYSDIVVRAGSQAEALAIATAQEKEFWSDPDDPRAEYRGFSLDGSNLTVTKVDPAGETKVICTSYHAG